MKVTRDAICVLSSCLPTRFQVLVNGRHKDEISGPRDDGVGCRVETIGEGAKENEKTPFVDATGRPLRDSNTSRARAISALDDESHARPPRMVTVALMLWYAVSLLSGGRLGRLWTVSGATTERDRDNDAAVTRVLRWQASECLCRTEAGR